jgi:hypothetical protein
MDRTRVARDAKGTDMNDLERLLTDHLGSKAASLAPTDRLNQVHAAGRAASIGRTRFAVPPAWLGAAAGVLAAVGVGAVIVERASDPSPPPATVAPGALPVMPGPTVNDHWHQAYAFWLCGEWMTLRGALEQPPLNERYITTGIHSHDDGVIHIHPFGSLGSGPNATLGAFLGGYGVVLTDDSLQFPRDQRREALGSTCNGEPAELTVTVWPDAADPNVSVIYTDRLADVQLRDGAAMTIALSTGASSPMPPAAADLDELGAVDGGGTTPGGDTGP